MHKPALRLVSTTSHTSVGVVSPGRGTLTITVYLGRLESRVVANWSVLIEGNVTTGSIAAAYPTDRAIRLAAALFLKWSPYLIDV